MKSTFLVALAAVAILSGTTSAQQCAAGQYAPRAQQAPQYQYQPPQVVQVPLLAVPLYVVPSAPTVQLNVVPQYQYAAPVVQAAPVVVQKQVIQKQAAPVIVKQQAAPQRQRSFSLQRTVIR